MANYYKDHPEIDFHLNHPLMRRIAELKERGYTEVGECPGYTVCIDAVGGKPFLIQDNHVCQIAAG